jgi:hypothetical protein
LSAIFPATHSRTTNDDLIKLIGPSFATHLKLSGLSFASLREVGGAQQRKEMACSDGAYKRDTLQAAGGTRRELVPKTSFGVKHRP